MKGYIAALLFCIAGTLFAQESIIKDFAESKRDRKFCLYPSTLRMINLSGDPEFYKLVNDVEKLLIYSLDSATIAAGQYTNWMDEYIANGFEEYVSMSGRTKLRILGKEEEFVGLTGAEGNVIAFYLRGSIGFQKIPQLIQNFESGDILNILTDQFNE